MIFIAPMVVGILVVLAVFWKVAGEAIMDSLRVKNPWD